MNAKTSTVSNVSAATSQDDLLEPRRLKNEMAKRLLQSWLAEDPEYDIKAWAIVKPLIEENRLSARRRFDD